MTTCWAEYIRDRTDDLKSGKRTPMHHPPPKVELRLKILNQKVPITEQQPHVSSLNHFLVFFGSFIESSAPGMPWQPCIRNSGGGLWERLKLTLSLVFLMLSITETQPNQSKKKDGFFLWVEEIAASHFSFFFTTQTPSLWAVAIYGTTQLQMWSLSYNAVS